MNSNTLVSARYRKVMVIDDNSTDRYICDRASRTFGLSETVISMESGPDALSYLRAYVNTPAELPELIFLDVNMPEMNGFEFLDAYEELPELVRKKCIIVMLTSSTHSDDKNKVSRSSYVKGYLNKPLTREKTNSLW
jgi:CheY-like chemotaxis protein